MIDQKVRELIRMSRITVAVGAGVLVAACGTSSSIQSNGPTPSVETSDQTLPANIQDDGPPLKALAQGHVVVVDFFATWCEPCRESIPELNKLVDRHRGDGLRVVAVSIDAERDIVKDYVASAGVHYPVYHDPEQDYAAHFGVQDVPMVLVLNGDGRVLHRAKKVDDSTLAAVRAALGPP